LRLLLAPWGEPVSAAAGALVALLAAKPWLGDAATALARAAGPRIGSSVPRLEPYSGFLVVVFCSAGGIVVAVALWRALRRLPFSWLLPVVLVGATEGLALERGRWLASAVPIAIVAMARIGRSVWPIGVSAAALVPALWLLDGSTQTALHERLERLAAHQERPSFGDPYHYEFARAGDEHVDDELLRTARAIVHLSAPTDPVYCATWMLGGGAEAFLSHRRNPTSFDKPDEIASEALQRQALSELRADPPKLMVGTFFKYLGDEGRRFIEQGWHKTDDPLILERNP
jgi:hypothetical protein